MYTVRATKWIIFLIGLFTETINLVYIVNMINIINTVYIRSLTCADNNSN